MDVGSGDGPWDGGGRYVAERSRKAAEATGPPPRGVRAPPGVLWPEPCPGLPLPQAYLATREVLSTFVLTAANPGTWSLFNVLQLIEVLTG